MYDIIVIGSDICSLTAAMVSAHYGQKTLLLSERGSSHVFMDSGYLFNVDPTPMTGFGDNQSCFRLLSEFGIDFSQYSSLSVLNPALQVILPNHRIDVFNDIEALKNDMSREFPTHVKDIRDIYTSSLDLTVLIEQWINQNLHLRPIRYKHFSALMKNIRVLSKSALKFYTAITSIAKERSLKQTMEAKHLLFSYLYKENNNLLSITAPYVLTLPNRGVYYHAEGKNFLYSIMRDFFKTSGGHYVEGCSINNINYNKNYIHVEFSLNGSVSSIDAKNLIITTKSNKFNDLLLENRFKRLRQRIKNVDIAFNPFTIHMGVSEKGLPEKMGTHVVIIPDENKNIFDNNFIFLSISLPNDTLSAPVGKRTISATIFLKHSVELISDHDVERITRNTLSQISSFLPFLQENIDYLNINKSIQTSKLFHESLNPQYKIKNNLLPLGILSFSNRTPQKNIYLTGSMLFPHLGFEGEIISGINSVFSVIEKEF